MTLLRKYSVPLAAGAESHRRVLVGISIMVILMLANIAPLHTSFSYIAEPKPMYAGASQAPVPRNITFYMHNTSIGKDINGVITPYIMGTTQNFGKNNTVTKVQDNRQDWYLYPVLSGNLTLNGSIIMHSYVSIDQSGSQMNPTLSVSEINPSGTQIWSWSNTFGGMTWWTTPHDLVLTSPKLNHIFSKGSTILVVLSITSGSRSTTIWYNASWVPTQIIFQCDDFARIDSVSFYDWRGLPKTNFDGTELNKTLRIEANVSDPLGGYDIHWVNVTLTAPDGSTIIDSAPMTQVTGSPISYLSVYERLWNYSGHSEGRYNVTITVLDNSGYYHFLQFFDTDGFLSVVDSWFFIGGLLVNVYVKIIDDMGAPLDGATVNFLRGSTIYASRISNSTGTVMVNIERGTYNLIAWWQQIEVASISHDFESNFTFVNPFVVSCNVYSPIFQSYDAESQILPGVKFVFIHPNGDKLGPYLTNETGSFVLNQVPVGIYELTASWRGVDVYHDFISVTASEVFTIITAVYELTVIVKSSDGNPIANVFISAENQKELVFDAGFTGPDGTINMFMPQGNYTINYRYITSVMGTLYDSGARSTTAYVPSEPITIIIDDFPILLTSTLQFLFAVVYAITFAILLMLFYLLWRRKKGGSPEENTSKTDDDWLDSLAALED